MWTKSKRGVRRKLRVCKRRKNCGRKVADFRLPNKTEWTLDYSPETLCLHLQLSVNTVHWKGWEPTFFIRAFGISKELSTEVGFAFSNNCLKSEDLQFRMKFFRIIFLIMFPDFRFCLAIVSIHFYIPMH